MLSQEHNISIEKALSYQLGPPVPWTLATADGCPMKTDKAKLLHNVEKDTCTLEKPHIYKSVYVYDGNVILQAILPCAERVDFVTDTYKDGSIKSLEREKRGITETFLVQGPKTKVPRDWKSFMCNGDNKTQLIKLLRTEWCMQRN